MIKRVIIFVIMITKLQSVNLKGETAWRDQFVLAAFKSDCVWNGTTNEHNISGFSKLPLVGKHDKTNYLSKTQSNATI
jgi:hypothetical protein